MFVTIKRIYNHGLVTDYGWIPKDKILFVEFFSASDKRMLPISWEALTTYDFAGREVKVALRSASVAME